MNEFLADFVDHIRSYKVKIINNIKIAFMSLITRSDQSVHIHFDYFRYLIH